MNYPLISIIVPVYNGEQYIDRCIKSVLNQLYYNWELILVDDGSTDASGIICDEYASRYSSVKVFHTKNRGLSAARNFGIKNADGDLISFLDCDDIYSNRFLSHLYEVMTQYKTDVAKCQHVSNIQHFDDDKAVKISVLCGEDEIMPFFFRLNGEPSYYGVWTGLYRRELFNEVYFIEGKINEDVRCTYDVYRRTRSIAISNQNLYFYYVNKKGITNGKLRKKDLDLIYIWDSICKDEEGGKYEDAAHLNRNRADFTLLAKGAVRGISNDFPDEEIERLRDSLTMNKTKLLKSKMLDCKRKLLIRMMCN